MKNIIDSFSDIKMAANLTHPAIEQQENGSCSWQKDSSIIFTKIVKPNWFKQPTNQCVSDSK
jgi:hypothetical protein